MLAIGVALLVGGFASLVMPTVAAVGLAFIAAILVQFALRGLESLGVGSEEQARPKPIEAPRVAAGIPDARREVVSKVLDEATAELRKLEAARARLADPGAAAIVQRMVLVGQRLTTMVAAEPEKLAQAQRLLTYHLPKAVFVAELLAQLGDPPHDQARAQDARLVLARMDNLFEKTELDLKAGDARGADLELRLIHQALDEDLGQRPT